MHATSVKAWQSFFWSIEPVLESALVKLLSFMPQIGQRFSGAKKDAPEYARGNYLLRTLGMQASHPLWKCSNKCLIVYAASGVYLTHMT